MFCWNKSSNCDLEVVISYLYRINNCFNGWWMDCIVNNIWTLNWRLCHAYFIVPNCLVKTRANLLVIIWHIILKQSVLFAFPYWQINICLVMVNGNYILCTRSHVQMNRAGFYILIETELLKDFELLSDVSHHFCNISKV